MRHPPSSPLPDRFSNGPLLIRVIVIAIEKPCNIYIKSDFESFVFKGYLRSVVSQYECKTCCINIVDHKNEAHNKTFLPLCSDSIESHLFSSG